MIGLDIGQGVSDAREALAGAERIGDPRLIAAMIAKVGHAELYAADLTPGLVERGVEIEGSLETGLGHLDSPGSLWPAGCCYLVKSDGRTRPLRSWRPMRPREATTTARISSSGTVPGPTGPPVACVPRSSSPTGRKSWADRSRSGMNAPGWAASGHWWRRTWDWPKRRGRERGRESRELRSSHWTYTKLSAEARSGTLNSWQATLVHTQLNRTPPIPAFR